MQQPRPRQRGGFYETIAEAIDDMARHGYDSQQRLDLWLDRIRHAAALVMVPLQKLEEELKAALRTIYQRQIERGFILKRHPEVSLFTLEKVKPKLRPELDRRIMASAQLIKLNRDQAMETMLRRFAGWSTSIPAGGSDVVDKAEVKAEIHKPLRQLPFTERRVAIDQGHKFAANLSDILAVDSGAIAGIWHSHWREVNYDYRVVHKKRDLEVFVVRDNWALTQGLMKLDGHKYTDEIERPAELPFCRCFYQYITSVRRLPDGMITAKGRAELARAREALAL